MSFLRKLWGWIKKGVKALVRLFKNKGPMTVIEDAGKAVGGIATIATVAYTAYNVIRSFTMKGGYSKSKNVNRSGEEYIANRSYSDVEDRLAMLKRFDYKNLTSINREEAEILAEVAKTRNVLFQSMTPEEQMNILRMEGFDFDGFKEKLARKNGLRGIRRSERAVGEPTPEDEPWRTPVDYGFWNFIMRPLDDFLCWLKGDPTPKKVQQVNLIFHEEIPSVNTGSLKGDLEVLRSLGPYLDSRNGGNVPHVVTQAEIDDYKIQQIYAEKIFTIKDPAEFRKSVDKEIKKMLGDRNGLSREIFDLIGEDMKADKKHKKSGKKDDDDDEDEVVEKKKKKHKFSYDDDRKWSKKEEKSFEESADEEAKKMYDFHLKKSMKGEVNYDGYHLAKAFDQ